MSRIRSSIVCLLAACGADAAAPGPQPAWAGPPVAVEAQDGAAEVRLTVATGGFSLRLDSREADGSLLSLLYTLEAPAPEEIVTQAIQTLRHEVALPRAVTEVHVRVARVLRGARHVVAPPYELAAVLRR